MKWLKIILINFFIILFGIISLELVFGKWIFNKSQQIECFYVLCYSNTSFKHNLYSKDKIVTKYTKDKYGLRNRFKNVDKIDILLVGGSATDQRYLDNEHTWGNVLENFFHKDGKNIDIVNAGIDGQTTNGHIWNFEKWFNKIKGIKFKYVIFYIGINESDANYNDGRRKYIPLNFKNYIIDRSSVIYPLYKIIKGNFIAFKNRSYHGITDIKNHSFNFSSNLKKEYKKINKSNFEEGLTKNLNHLLLLSKKFNSKPIFITQRSLGWRILENKVQSDDLEGVRKAIYEMKSRDIILKFCNDNNILCIDSFNKFKLKNEYYYDLSHFNKKGSKNFGKFLYESLKSLTF